MLDFDAFHLQIHRSGDARPPGAVAPVHSTLNVSPLFAVICVAEEELDEGPASPMRVGADETPLNNCLTALGFAKVASSVM